MSDKSPLYMRMKQAVQWLKQNRQMFQKDIAAKMGITEVAFTNGLKRIQIKFDENFIISFHQATDGVFSLDWLMEGTGNMFENKKTTSPSIDEPTANIIELYASLIKEIEQTRQELKQELSELQSLKQEYLTAREDFRKAIAALHPSIKYTNPSEPTLMVAEKTKK